MFSGGYSRATIVGVGVWGAQVVAHLWPRLHMADRGRALAPGIGVPESALWDFHLPRLSNVVSHVLVLPDDDVSVTLARPQVERWNDVTFARQDESLFASVKITDQVALGARPAGAKLRRQMYQALWPTLDIIGRYEGEAEAAGPAKRRDLWKLFVDHRWDIADDLLTILEQARADESTPEEESAELTIFLVASLADELATAILWPLANLLREQVGSHVLTELVGLLSTGVYASANERRFKAASVHTAVRELAFLNRLAADGQRCPQAETLLGHTPPAEAPPPFDRTFLIDREKSSGALIKDEVELTTVAGNALEAFLTSEGISFLRSTLAPDMLELQRSGPFSSLGAACMYVPIEEMWAHARQRLSLDILQEHFLGASSPDNEAEARALADRFVTRSLDLRGIAETMLETDLIVPVSLAVDDEPADPFAVPELRILPPPAPLPGLRAITLGNVADYALAVNQAFEEFESAALTRWAESIAVRAAAIAAHASEDEASAQMIDALQRLDGHIRTMITTQERGLHTAIVHTASILDALEGQRKRLLDQRKVWRRQASADRADRRQRRLNLISGIPFLAHMPGWHILLAALALLLFIVVQIGLVRYGGVAAATALPYATAVAAFLFILGLLARLFYQRWLRGSLRHIARSREARLNLLAKALLADVYLTILNGLIADVARRLRALKHAASSLEEDSRAMAERLKEPLAGAQSFVRQPLTQEAFYEAIRSHPARAPAGARVARIFSEDSYSVELIEQAWELATTPEPIDQDGQVQPTPLDLAEALSITIERYAARLSQPEAPTDVNIEDMLGRVGADYSANGVLSSLRHKAKPCIHVDDYIVTAPIHVDLLAAPFAPATQLSPLGEFAAAQRLHLVSSYNPFTLILVRTMHHIPLDAIASLRAYAESYTRLSRQEQEALLLAEEALVEPEAG